MRAAFVSPEESKLVSSRPFMMNPRHLARLAFFALLIAVGAASVPIACAQFTLTPSALTPPAIIVGGTAVGSVSLQATPGSGFDSPVDLSCTLISGPVSSNPPTCVISPSTATPPAEPSITISTCGGVTSTCTAATPTGVYSFTIEGASGSATATANVSMNVVGTTAEDYNLSVMPTTATPNPVTAGNSATTTVTVSPIGDYTGSVTLVCLSITPAVEAEPYCTFTPPTVNVTSGGTPPTSTLTITTLGNVPTVTEVFHLRRLFYALFLAVPGLAIVASTDKLKLRTRLLGLFLLLVVAGSLVLLPACGGRTKNNPAGLTTPNNTYTFTLSASDNLGNGPANSTSPATVTLTVN